MPTAFANASKPVHEVIHLTVEFRAAFDVIPGDPLAKDIDNPCVSTCRLSGDLCVSCGRSKDDIRQWKRMKRPEKMVAVQRATLRLKTLKKGK
jgi:predicted Fe-S protein YdhL (DUF1289 family)